MLETVLSHLKFQIALCIWVNNHYMDKEQFSRNITWSVMAKKPPHWKRSIIGRARLLRLCTISWSVNGYWCVNTDKSRYITIPEFNNCFIIVSPNLFPYFNHSLTAQGSVCHLSHETVVTTTTIICMQLFAGCVVGSRPMKMKKKLNCSIVSLINSLNGFPLMWSISWSIYSQG